MNPQVLSPFLPVTDLNIMFSYMAMYKHYCGQRYGWMGWGKHDVNTGVNESASGGLTHIWGKVFPSLLISF